MVFLAYFTGKANEPRKKKKKKPTLNLKGKIKDVNTYTKMI